MVRKETFPGRGAVQYAASNLSWKLSGAGIPSFRPVCFHVSRTAWLGRLVWSKGSASRVWRCQEREGLAARVSPQVGREAKGPSRQAWGCQPPGTPLRRGPASCSGSPRCHQALLRTSDLHRWRSSTGRGRRSARHRGSAGQRRAWGSSEWIHVQRQVANVEASPVGQPPRCPHLVEVYCAPLVMLGR